MQKLFMLILGATPKGRHIEQHDIFFGIANAVNDLIPDIIDYWPEANGKIHIDAWREVTSVDGYSIKVIDKTELSSNDSASFTKLFFLNLGGYKPGEFEEYHYKMLAACSTAAEAIKQAKQSAFYKHTGFQGAASHIDDRYGVDVDDIYEIEDILPVQMKEKYRLQILQNSTPNNDELHIGYYKLTKL